MRAIQTVSICKNVPNTGTFLPRVHPLHRDTDRLEVLVTLVEAYEARHYTIPLLDPIAAIEYHMQRLGLMRKDLEPLVGSRGRVSEILNRKSPLTIRVIRMLSAGRGISAEALVQEHRLSEDKLLRNRLSNAGVKNSDQEYSCRVVLNVISLDDPDG